MTWAELGWALLRVLIVCWCVVALGFAFLFIVGLFVTRGAACPDTGAADEPIPYRLAESVDEYADRELQQFGCPHLDQVDIERLREIARRQASEVQP